MLDILPAGKECYYKLVFCEIYFLSNFLLPIFPNQLPHD
jgi:hypothetical protein